MPNCWDHVRHCLRSRRAEEYSGPVWWAYAIFLLLIALLILLAAITLLVVKPKLPNIAVHSHLNSFHYDPNQGRLFVELSVSPVLENHNSMVELVFSQVKFNLKFNRKLVMNLASADLFDVPRKGSLPLYFLKRAEIPLDHAGGAAAEDAMNRGLVRLTLTGEARTQWKVGKAAMKSWTRLSCAMSFLWPSGTSADIDCKTSSNL